MYDVELRICQHCKQPDADIAINSKWGDRKYYLCRKCNNDRAKRYRSTAHGRAMVNAAAKRWRDRNPDYRRKREAAKAAERHDLWEDPIDIEDWNKRARANRLGIIKRHAI